MKSKSDIGPGVTFSVRELRQMAAAALADQPTNTGPYLTLTDAAEKLERAARSAAKGVS